MNLAKVLSIPLSRTIEWCSYISGNYLTAIVFFTVLTKIILFPVSLWTHRNSLRMVSLMPELNRLKIKYYGDKDTIAEETQKLYKCTHYHPLASTIPMFIQLLLLIGVIGAVRELLTGTESMLSVHPARAGGITLLLPAAAGCSALLLGLAQNRLNPLQREQTKAGQWITNGLSITISLALGAFVPVGVGIYWIASNLLTIVQQMVLNAVMRPAKYVNYTDLRESRRELAEIESLSVNVSREDKQREKADYKKFFSIANKHLVFYSEKSGFYKYFQDVTEYLLTHSNIVIHYITSDPKDQIFSIAEKETHIKPYYISERKLITLMMKMDADMVVMTMPDLNNFHIKRSYIRKDIEYVFMFHWLTSTHMIIREHALDHYDTILCPGPYQIAELREAEGLYQTTEKTLIDSGYSLVERLEKQYREMPKKETRNPKILIGPSWQPDNIMDSAIDELLKQLLNRGYQITVRPHPEYVKRFPQKITDFQQRHAQETGTAFILDLDFSSNAPVYESDVLITDWSNVGYEYAFATQKPVLFIDTPPKVTNPNYTKYKTKPLDLILRTETGISLRPDELNKAAETITYLLCHAEDYRENILSWRKKILPQYGHSGEIGGRYILSKLVKRKGTQ